MRASKSCGWTSLTNQGRSLGWKTTVEQKGERVRSQSARTRSVKSSKPLCSSSDQFVRLKWAGKETHVVEDDVDSCVLERADVRPAGLEVVLEDKVRAAFDALEGLNVLVRQRR